MVTMLATSKCGTMSICCIQIPVTSLVLVLRRQISVAQCQYVVYKLQKLYYNGILSFSFVKDSELTIEWGKWWLQNELLINKKWAKITCEKVFSRYWVISRWPDNPTRKIIQLEPDSITILGY